MPLDRWPYLLIAALSKLLALDRTSERPKKLELLFPPFCDPKRQKASPADSQSLVPLFPSSALVQMDRILQGLPLEHSLPSPHYRSGMPDSHSEEPSASPAPISSTQIPPEDSPLEPYIEQIQHQMRHRWRAEPALTEPSRHSAHLHVGHQSQIASPHLEGRNLLRIDDTLRPLLSHSYPPSPEDPLAHQRVQGLSSF